MKIMRPLKHENIKSRKTRLFRVFVLSWRVLVSRKVLILSIVALFISCEKVSQRGDPENDPVTNFDLLWTTLDQKYTFFSFKKIDWDSIYNVYRPLVYEEMSDRQLFNLMADMLFQLRDGHTNLFTEFDIARNWTWFLDYPPNFNYNIIERNYLKDDYEITGPLYNTIIDSIGYIYYGSFGAPVDDSHIDYVIYKFRGLKGLIFDIRDNGGGLIANVDKLVSRFTDHKRVSHVEVYKDGPAHDDFEDPIPYHIEPAGPRQFTKPVVVLTNRSVYSAANQFVLQMKALPHVTVIGDTTGGGGGIPIGSELPNGWTYRYSASMTLAPDGFNIEHGIPPDEYKSLDPTDEANGIDSIIERALEFL